MAAAALSMLLFGAGALSACMLVGLLQRGPGLLKMAREKAPALLWKVQLVLRRCFPGRFNKVKDESTELSDRKSKSGSRRQSSSDGGAFIQAISKKQGHGGHLRDADAETGTDGGLHRGSITQHQPLLQHEDEGGPREDYGGEGEPYPEVDFQAF